ncbi:MAG: hypothetical protein IK997_04110 [Bacilli bacterium]|nr:hypothetical protein [Bacilli bacterium]
MKILKKIVFLTSFILLVFVSYMFIVSFSFKYIYYNSTEDSTIILKRQRNKSIYTYKSKKENVKGKIEVDIDKIVLTNKNSIIATAIYKNNERTLKITGSFGKDSYMNGKFKQITSIKEYFKSKF